MKKLINEQEFLEIYNHFINFCSCGNRLTISVRKKRLYNHCYRCKNNVFCYEVKNGLSVDWGISDNNFSIIGWKEKCVSLEILPNKEDKIFFTSKQELIDFCKKFIGNIMFK